MLCFIYDKSMFFVRFPFYRFFLRVQGYRLSFQESCLCMLASKIHTLRYVLTFNSGILQNNIQVLQLIQRDIIKTYLPLFYQGHHLFQGFEQQDLLIRCLRQPT